MVTPSHDTLLPPTRLFSLFMISSPEPKIRLSKSPSTPEKVHRCVACLPDAAEALLQGGREAAQGLRAVRRPRGPVLLGPVQGEVRCRLRMGEDG